MPTTDYDTDELMDMLANAEAKGRAERREPRHRVRANKARYN